MLQCNVKKCQNFPLDIDCQEFETTDAEFNKEFLQRLFVKVDWHALQLTLKSLGWPVIAQPLSNEENNMNIMDTDTIVPFDDSEDSFWWNTFFDVLMKRNIMTGKMTCSKCGHLFPIKDGIPNMLLREDEI